MKINSIISFFNFNFKAEISYAMPGITRILYIFCKTNAEKQSKWQKDIEAANKS